MCTFEKGWNELRFIDRKKARAEIMTALNINNLQSFRNYRKGKHTLSVQAYLAIKKIFAKYGVKKPFNNEADIDT